MFSKECERKLTDNSKSGIFSGGLGDCKAEAFKVNISREEAAERREKVPAFGRFNPMLLGMSLILSLVISGSFMLTKVPGNEGKNVTVTQIKAVNENQYKKIFLAGKSKLSTKSMKKMAKKFSTKKNADAGDFDWLVDYLLLGGKEQGRVISDPEQRIQIRGSMKELLNGGWKAYMFTKEGEYGSAQERYFNVELKTSKKSFKAQANWAYIYDTNTGESIEEKGSDIFKGKFDNSKGRATVKSDFAMIEFDAFYISKDYSTEYGLGTVSWISGEKERIGIMRRRKVRR